MNMTFTYKDTDTVVECAVGDMLKLYSVPLSYSDDGLYLAAWRRGEIEPFPACAGSEALLLAHITVQGEQDTPTFSGYVSKEVSINATA